ncbi:MAG: hypothetical protein E7479_05205 [Ruminococcaceae bacterium]|nr:hypothetical protein [Oscillospiraceae bacterium]
MKKILSVLAAMFFCLAFSGCTVFETDTEALMKPPVFTEEQEKLNSALANILGESYVLKYPENGETNSAFVFRDLDGDGTEEAMAFYSLFDDNTRINILKKEEDGWISVCEAPGFYGEIKSVDFAETEKNQCLIVIKWEQEIGIYSYSEERLGTIHKAPCEGADIADIDGNGFSEIVIFSGSATGRSIVSIVYSVENTVAVTEDISVHAVYDRIFAKTTGKIEDGRTMYFLDSEIYDGVYLTEMIALEEGTAKRYFIADFVESEPEERVDNEGLVSVGAYGKRRIFLRNTKAFCLDTNHDGITEMPVEYREDYAHEASEEKFFLQYMQFDGEESKPVWNGAANPEGGYLFEVPESWNEKFEIKFGSSADEFLFAEKGTGETVFVIFAVSKNDYQDKYEDCVFAAENETKNYYIKSYLEPESDFYIEPETFGERFIFIG